MRSSAPKLRTPANDSLFQIYVRSLFTLAAAMAGAFRLFEFRASTGLQHGHIFYGFPAASWSTLFILRPEWYWLKKRRMAKPSMFDQPAET